MILYVLLGLLAAFGLLCALWALFGCFLPGSCRCTLILRCRAQEENGLLRRLLWLRELGLLRCRIVLSGCGISNEQREILLRRYGDIEFCDPEQPGE